MQTELKLMHSFLKDADRRQDEDDRVRDWVSQIREVAYDAEAVIEIFTLRIASRRRGGFRNALKSGGEGSCSAYGRQRQWRQSYSHIVEEYTVGLDEDVKVLVAQLLKKEKNCGVVSICGMGGLGKTTLAKKIYHHIDIKRHFDGFSWAYISQQCQRRDVWEGVLFNLISPSKEQREEIVRFRDDELAEKLYQVLAEKKCLMILDDIWTTEAWDSLRPAFLDA